MKSRTHSPASRTCASCSGSALTLGIRRNSESSSSHAWSTSEESTHTSVDISPAGRLGRPAHSHDAKQRALKSSPIARAQSAPARSWSNEVQSTSFEKPLGDVAKDLRVGQRAELLQRLILDLPDALARHVERAPDLVERP